MAYQAWKSYRATDFTARNYERYACTIVLLQANDINVTGPAKTGHVGSLFLPTFSIFPNS